MFRGLKKDKTGLFGKKWNYSTLFWTWNKIKLLQLIGNIQEITEMYFTFCSWLFWSPQLRIVVTIRNQKNFIKACNLYCLSSNYLKKIVKTGKLGKRNKRNLSIWEKKWSFFCKICKWRILLFLPPAKTKLSQFLQQKAATLLINLIFI